MGDTHPSEEGPSEGSPPLDIPVLLIHGQVGAVPPAPPLSVSGVDGVGICGLDDKLAYLGSATRAPVCEIPLILRQCLS